MANKYTVFYRNLRRGLPALQSQREFSTDLPLEELVARIKNGDPSVWRFSDFGVTKRVNPHVEHYVGGRWTIKGNGTSRVPQFSVQVSGPITLNGNVTKPMKFFKDLHEKLWRVLDREFSKEELLYITAEITGDADKRDREYMRKFKQDHFGESVCNPVIEHLTT